MSVQDIRSWCKKNVDWCHHPQSASKRKQIILSIAEHRHLISKGIEILEMVNENVCSEQPPFQLVGDPNVENVRCF